MNPLAHLATSWTLSAFSLKSRRDRIVLAISGTLPDIDGVGIILDLINKKTTYYQDFHHYIGHNIFFILSVSMILTFFSTTKSMKFWALCVISMHLHLLCDLVGSRGPDGYQWPIYYVYPLSESFELVWSGQWPLSSYQNVIYMAILLLISVVTGYRKRITLLEVMSVRLNDAASDMVERWVRRIVRKRG